MDTYNVNINFVEYYGIISAIPNNLKQIILDENIKLVNISINYLFREFSKNLYIYCHEKMGKRFRNVYRRLAWYLFIVILYR